MAAKASRTLPPLSVLLNNARRLCRVPDFCNDKKVSGTRKLQPSMCDRLQLGRPGSFAKLFS